MYGCLFFLFLTFTAKAQNPDSLFRRLSRQLALSDSDTASQSAVFLHLDKTLYTADESVWFAAYLLNAPNTQAHHTLYVTLLNEMEHSVVASYQFALEQGLASGSFALPDSLQSGKYCLTAYTNKSIVEQNPHIFRQPLEVLGLRKDPFGLHITGTEQGHAILFTGRVTRTEAGSALPATISFTLLADGQPYKTQQQSLSRSGEIQFTVPAALASKSLEIVGKLGEGREQLAFKRPLTWSSSGSLVSFFPAAGQLRAGQATQVAVSAKDAAGSALSTRCTLLENNVEVTSFTTDRLGNGLFSFTPKLEKQYVVKFREEKAPPRQTFPVVRASTWSIRPVSTVVSDTLLLYVTTPSLPSEGLVAIHDGRAMRYGAYLRLRQAETLLKVPVGHWTPGIAYVCLYQKDGTLLEKRLVLIQSRQPLRVALQTDSASYQPLSSITLKVKLTNSQGQPVKGLFSFSAALAQAITAEAKDIEVFSLYERFLPDHILLPPALFLTNEPAVKSLLLRQENVLADSAWAFLHPGSPDRYDGYVLYYGKRPKKPVDLLLSGKQTTLLQTDNAGRFTLPYQALRTDAGKKVTLSVVSKNPAGYKLELTSPWARINTTLAKQPLWHSYLAPDALSSEQKQLLASSTKVFLKEVVITAKKAESDQYYGRSNSSGVCTDYVCQFDVLNCPYHTGVKSPVEGHWYNLETSTGIKRVLYHCQYQTRPLFIREVPATVTYTPFTPFNPSEPSLPGTKPSTTLHWQAFVETNEQGEATLRFHTNARSGRFKALVQGMAGNSVFSSELYFEVSQ
ncbi:hypothetical protein LRS06_00915 [Hymenobacter sp. J193]|uniref:hypothetical protein n=1 Tax=Hymenobacter sp. J193 TaxID=2898429 RepID=UPI0021510AEE|nr:hypothetical protein [Hymenobacter sp. J193]MCR5886354.1 hypothetical protein [Hymenobacter sp. J193]